MTSIEFAQLITTMGRLEIRGKHLEQLSNRIHRQLELATTLLDVHRAETGDRLKELEHNLGALFPPRQPALIFDDEQG